MLRRALACLVPLLLLFTSIARADDAFSALAQARQQCARGAPALRPNGQLQEAASRLARGAALPEALKASGYRAQRSFEWQLSGYSSAAAVAHALGTEQCAQLGRADLLEAG